MRGTPADAVFHGDQQTAAQVRIHLALDSIQAAHLLVEQATQALSRVDGMIPLRRRVVALSNLLTQTWYALRAAANRLRRKAHRPVDCL